MAMVLTYKFFAMERDADWMELYTPLVSFKRSPPTTDQIYTEKDASETLHGIKSHQRFTVAFPTDTATSFLHMLFRAISGQWEDLKAEIAVVRLSGSDKQNVTHISSLSFDAVQVLDHNPSDFGYYFNFNSMGNIEETVLKK